MNRIIIVLILKVRTIPADEGPPAGDTLIKTFCATKVKAFCMKNKKNNIEDKILRKETDT